MTLEKLDNQRDVVKNERRWRIDNQPYGDWDERIQEMIYPNDHPYHHSVIGSMEDLDAASLDDIEQFFRTYYAPNNAVLSLVGDFEPAHARDLIEMYFGEIPASPPIPPIPGRTKIPIHMGGGVRDRIEQDIALARVYQAYRIPPYGSDEYYAGLVASYILGTGKAALLYRTLVRDRQIAQDVTAYSFPIVVGASMMTLWATARPGTDIDVVDAALTEQVESLRTIGDADVERAIALLDSVHLRDLQTVEERADQLSMYTTLFNEPDRINTELARVRSVTTADVRTYASAYLDRENCASLIYTPRNGGNR